MAQVGGGEVVLLQAPSNSFPGLSIIIISTQRSYLMHTGQHWSALIRVVFVHWLDSCTSFNPIRALVTHTTSFLPKAFHVNKMLNIIFELCNESSVTPGLDKKFQPLVEVLLYSDLGIQTIWILIRWREG